MGLLAFDLYKNYKTTFGNLPYTVQKNVDSRTDEPNYIVAQNERQLATPIYTTKNIALNKASAIGRDIWFPVQFWASTNFFVDVDACTVAVQMIKNIIRTAIPERKGTVKEQVFIDDYRFTIKGFLIGPNRSFPEDQIVKLKTLFEQTTPLYLKGGYPELFLEENGRVVITALDFPEVEGKSHYVRPFSLQCESDYIQDLIIS